MLELGMDQVTFLAVVAITKEIRRRALLCYCL